MAKVFKKLKRIGGPVFLLIFISATLTFLGLQVSLFWEEMQWGREQLVKEEYNLKLLAVESERDQFKGQVLDLEEKLTLVSRESESREALAGVTRTVDAARLTAALKQAEASKIAAEAARQELQAPHPPGSYLTSNNNANSHYLSLAQQKAETAKERIAAIRNAVRHSGAEGVQAGLQTNGNGFTRPMDNDALNAFRPAQHQAPAGLQQLLQQQQQQRQRQQQQQQQQQQQHQDEQQQQQQQQLLFQQQHQKEQDLGWQQLKDQQQGQQQDQQLQLQQTDEGRERAEEQEQRPQEPLLNPPQGEKRPKERELTDGSDKPKNAHPNVVAAVVIMACNRPDYLVRTLQSVFAVNPSLVHFPVFVSQDGLDPGVKALAQKFHPELGYMQHIETEPPKMRGKKEQIAYYRIAWHYQWALGQLFDAKGYARVIILEDDMALSPDFFSFFEAMAPLLDADPSLWCVSSWNDNGQERFVADPSAVYRSDFFPGLGWMLTQREWAELGGMWTTGPNTGMPGMPGPFGGYWDDWMRLNVVRRGRQCLRPEICRTFNFGEQGSSHGQFFKDHLQYIKLNNVSVDFSQQDLSYLDKKRYRVHITQAVALAKEVHIPSEISNVASGDVVIRYGSQAHYKQLAVEVGIMHEWKSGVPRGSYQGVVTFRANDGNVRVFLAPGRTINMHPTEGYIIPADGSRP